jgi:hypothetical protein
MKVNTNFTKILTKIHENKWVALSSNRKKVIDYDDKLIDLTKRIGGKDVIYMKVPSMEAVFAFSSKYHETRHMGKI